MIEVFWVDQILVRLFPHISKIKFIRLFSSVDSDFLIHFILDIDIWVIEGLVMMLRFWGGIVGISTGEGAVDMCLVVEELER